MLQSVMRDPAGWGGGGAVESKTGCCPLLGGHPAHSLPGLHSRTQPQGPGGDSPDNTHFVLPSLPCPVRPLS